MSETYISDKHPKALWYIIAIYMWEYFSFYGMRALLILYLIDHLKFGDSLSYAIAGSYVTLVYLSPVAGGILADKFLGYKHSVIFGAVLMSIGHLILGVGGDGYLYLGMSFIVAGYGFFKSNISCLLGQQYNAYDVKKDSAFTLLYLGGNLGGVFAPMLCGIVANLYGWHYGFGVAGIGMLFGLFIFMIGIKHVKGQMPETTESSLQKMLTVVVGTALIIFLSYLALDYLIDGYLLAIIVSIAVFYFIVILLKAKPNVRKSLLILVPFFIFGIVFWVFNEQLYTSVEIFIHRNVDTYFLGFDIPASAFTSMNSLSIIFGGLIVAWVWKKVKSLDDDFGKMVKFSLGFIFQIICFVLFFIAAKNASVDGTTSATLVIIALAFLGVSELFIDPIVFSEITSIEDKKHTGFLAALYMLFTGSVAGFIGAKVADFAAIKHTTEINLVAQAKLFESLFINVLIILIITTLLWFACAFVIKKIR